MRQFVANEIPKECISETRIQGFLKELHEKHQTCEEMIKTSDTRTILVAYNDSRHSKFYQAIQWYYAKE